MSDETVFAALKKIADCGTCAHCSKIARDAMASYGRFEVPAAAPTVESILRSGHVGSELSFEDWTLLQTDHADRPFYYEALQYFRHRLRK